MKIAKHTVALIAAISVAAAPVAGQAAPVRAASEVAQAEGNVGNNSALLLGLLMAAAAAIVLLSTNDRKAPNQPTSP